MIEINQFPRSLKDLLGEHAYLDALLNKQSLRSLDTLWRDAVREKQEITFEQTLKTLNETAEHVILGIALEMVREQSAEKNLNDLNAYDELMKIIDPTGEGSKPDEVLKALMKAFGETGIQIIKQTFQQEIAELIATEDYPPAA